MSDLPRHRRVCILTAVVFNFIFSLGKRVSNYVCSVDKNEKFQKTLEKFSVKRRRRFPTAKMLKKKTNSKKCD